MLYRRAGKVVAALAAVAAVAAVGAVGAVPAAAQAAEPAATFAKDSDWGTGFVGQYTVRNRGSEPMDGWRLEFDLPAGVEITNAWDGKTSASSGHVAVTPEDWTREIAPGASVKIGFEGSRSVPFEAPENCSLNGEPCADGAPPPQDEPDTTAPTAPSGLTATGQTAGTVSLRWDAATDDVGVKEYAVYRGETKVADATATSATVGELSPATAYTFSVKALDAAGNVSPVSNAVTATTRPAGSDEGTPGERRFAPYVDMTLWPQFDMGAAARTAGVKDFSLGFIVSKGECKASWGTYLELDDKWVNDSIADLRAAGGDAIVSFGGAANKELAESCQSVDALTAQYQSVIDAYGIRDLDFDIEGAAQRDVPSLERRAKAIAAIQAAGRAAGKPVHVSFTLAVLPTGLTADGERVLRIAKENGVDIGIVNVMAMDYFDPALPVAGRMGDHAISAATGLQRQLAALYPDRSDAQLWGMVGVTPMIGINDNPEEIFTTDDAVKLAKFAKEKQLGRLAMWSANRDSQCTTPQSTVSNTCSGVSQAPWAFSDALGAFL